jgi:hypothetical protein
MARKPVLTEQSRKPITTDSIRRNPFLKPVDTPPKNAEPKRLWIWLTLLILAGALVLGIAGMATWNWIRSFPLFTSSTTAPPAVTTYKVARTLPYADLNVTVLTAQSASSFSNDAIHAGPETIRLNVQISNTTTSLISITYYDVVRLLLPKHAPITPVNLQLSTDVPANGSVKGWIDFPVPAGSQLSSLKLQLGSALLNETLVVMPLSGPYRPENYAVHHSPQSLVIYYTFEGNTLTYHLNSIDVSYSYHGHEVKAGDQFYILNFTVDNPNGADVSPGFGYDYIRLVNDGVNRAPYDNTLPNTFKAGAQSVGGHVVYVEPIGLNQLTIGFLLQLVAGQDNYSVGL